KGLSLLSRNTLGMYGADVIPLTRQLWQAVIDWQSADYQDAEKNAIGYVQAGYPNASTVAAILAEDAAGEHDLEAARATLNDTADYRIDFEPGRTAFNRIRARMRIDSASEDWSAVLSDADAF